MLATIMQRNCTLKKADIVAVITELIEARAPTVQPTSMRKKKKRLTKEKRKYVERLEDDCKDRGGSDHRLVRSGGSYCCRCSNRLTPLR